MTGLIKRLIWMAALSCLIPRSATTDTCTIATKSVTATCGVATAITGLLGALFCAVTFGAGCPAIAAVGAVAATCSAVSGNVPCGGSEMEQVLGLLNDIKSDLEELSNDIELGFFDQSYDDDIQTIRNAAELYQKYVIDWSTVDGILVDTEFGERWLDKMTDYDYDVVDALMEIEDMIKGEVEGLTPKPSVYKIARENGLCSEKLYRFNLDLLMEGTTLYLITLEMAGTRIPQQLMEELKDRILLNERMYETYCQLNMPLESFRIKLSDRDWADTTGNLRIGVRQGDTKCGSVTETFDSPRRNTEYTQDDERKFGTCTKSMLFQPLYNNNPLQLRILSDTGNDAYIDKMAVKLGGEWREWTGHHFMINKHGEGPWSTVIESVSALDSSHFTASQNSYRNVGWAQTAERAIDGNTDGQNYDSSRTCSHTLYNYDNWWTLDLGGNYKVFKVVIYNRDDRWGSRIDGARVSTFSGGTKKVDCGEVEFENDKSVYELQCGFAIADQIKIVQDNDYLTLCEVEVYGEPVSQRISNGLTASQSSTRTGGGAANRAIDGNTDGHLDRNSCTHTLTDRNNWWTVNLGGNYRVYKVIIYNREDCCQDRINGARVIALHGDRAVEACGEVEYQSDKRIYEIRCTGRVVANQIKIDQPNNFLSLCEVEIYGSERGPNTAEACEHSGIPLSIDCRGKVINIKRAAFGVYSNDNTCGVSYSGHCIASTSLQVMQERCNGRNSCAVEAAHRIFGDPCAGTGKYLTATWECT